ncbi:MAG: protein translocase subunit SecF, partial [Selenomonadaceae bacterium]|nr:protein translocase subunit SecF [Selenomonadaceae bacterium]
FALIVGFSSGCYSSIFIAGPLWLTLREMSNKKSK